VTLADGTHRTYRAVLVANGHLWSPRMADFPGTFDGMQMHSHHYRTAAPFEGQDVLVIGIGNSAVDIAVDLARQARSVTLSTRRGAWVMPKYIMGIPTDRWGAFFSRRLKLPTRVTRMILGRLLLVAVGDQQRYGVPRPKTPIWREHACVSQDLLPYVGHGWIRIKPNVRALDGREVAFVDDSRAPFDAIIHATGYRTEFPFLDPAVFEVRDNQVSLYRRIVAPDRPGLYFMGLVQPVGPTIPLVEIQGRWIAGVLSGDVKLPDRSRMLDEIAAHRDKLRRTYVDSARYTLEVDFREHARDLLGDLAH
jgi:dimethylaniline monooxygenase (N-oxide forming)